MELQVKLKQVLIARDMTQKDLAQLSGLTENIISEIATNRRTSINRAHITKIIQALQITNLNEIFEIK